MNTDAPSTNALAQERCFNHRKREAVARCPECRRCFCRECVTEHDDRVICASCLKILKAGGVPTGRRFLGVRLALELTAGFLALWMLFYYTGRGLLRIPTSFHEGTLWKNGEAGEADVGPHHDNE